MKTTIYFLAILALFSCLSLYGQITNTWTAFWNYDSTLIGFKDKFGVVQIEPKFTGITPANKFDDIMAVIEEDNGTYKSYYLTKSGRIVGNDSLHFFDNGVDCESEGFIRFRDKITDMAGMFNRDGDVVISAEYNELTRVRNGMVVALKGATKEYWDKDKHSGCNHFSWTGGQELLIDTLNNILIENFSYDNSLDFFSLDKSKSPHSDSIRKSFLAKDATYYSFVDYEKEFKQWITTNLLANLTTDKLISASLDTITWGSPDGWVKSNRADFIADNFLVLKNGLTELLLSTCDYSISIDGLNPFMYDGAEFEKYFNNCGEAKDYIYPVMDIVVSHITNSDLSQDHYEFLRTDNGYKLLSVTIRNGKLK